MPVFNTHMKLTHIIIQNMKTIIIMKKKSLQEQYPSLKSFRHYSHKTQSNSIGVKISAAVFFENYVHVSSKLKVDKIFQRSALGPFQDSKTST